MSTDGNTITDNIDLTGQVALITGAGRGIGRTTAQFLAEAGASVTVTARSEDQLRETVDSIESQGGTAIAVPGDVTNRQDVRNVVAVTAEKLGPIDLLVNNAGSGLVSGPLWETDEEDWWHCVEVNLQGPFLFTRAVLPSMVSRGTGRIVNVSSGSGLQPQANHSAYVIAKTGLIRLTENLAVEVEKHGVKAFTVHPGTVRTAMAHAVLDSDQQKEWLPWFSPIFENGHDYAPEDAAHLIRLLASGKADEFSGRYFSVEGDGVPYDDLEEMRKQTERIKEDRLYFLRLRRG